MIKTKPQTKEYDENYDKIYGIPLWRMTPKQWVKTKDGHKFYFDHVDGAYSLCKEIGGGISHYSASLKVYPDNEQNTSL